MSFWRTASFRDHVAHVFEMGTGCEMRRLHTGWIVTGVHDVEPIGNRANEEFVRSAMSVNSASLFELPDFPVTMIVQNASPLPAPLFRARWEVVKEPLQKRPDHGWWRRWRISPKGSASYTALRLLCMSATQPLIRARAFGASWNAAMTRSAVLLWDMGTDWIAVVLPPLIVPLAPAPPKVFRFATVNRARFHARIIPQTIGFGHVCGLGDSV